MAKNEPFHIKSPVKNFHGRAKGGHRTVPLPPKYATGSSCSWVGLILLYFHQFRHNSLFAAKKSPKTTKHPFLGFKVIQDHRRWHS